MMLKFPCCPAAQKNTLPCPVWYERFSTDFLRENPQSHMGLLSEIQLELEKRRLSLGDWASGYAQHFNRSPRLIRTRALKGTAK